MRLNYSLHKITKADSFSFDAGAYSRFKFGDGLVSEKFGIDLARGFIETQLKENPISKQLVIISSPFCFIPTATFAMKNHFVFELNRWLADNNLPVVQEAKVHRTITYKEDYGELNAEERINLIGNDSFHIDAGFLEDKVLVFLDDIKITGSHERMITRMLEEYQLKNDIYLLYFAELTNKEIHPNIENYLNYFAVKSIFDLKSIINTEHFVINTRLVKYILNSEKTVFNLFIEDQTSNFIDLLYNMAIGNSYHTIEAYSENLEIIKKLSMYSTKNYIAT
jgi:hypothetical protein